MSNVTTYTVYAMLCPITKNVRYIGYTKYELIKRLKGHYNDAKNGIRSHKTNWLSSLKEPAIIVPIESGIPTLDEAVTKECYWISCYSWLTNSTTGGEKSKAYREDVRKKMSDYWKGRMMGEKNPAFGRKRPDLAVRNKARIITDKERLEQSDKMIKMYSTPEYKKKFVETQKNRKILLQLTMSGELVREWSSQNRAREEGGFDSKSIIQCLRGLAKQHKGFKWAVK